MVDTVLELRDGYVTSARTFHAGEPFFAGHFPGRPTVPGVFLLEGLAQTMAYYALSQKPGQRVLLVGLDRVRFRSVVEPGVEVTFEVKLGEQRFGLLTGRGLARVGALRVAEATLKGLAGDGAGNLG